MTGTVSSPITGATVAGLTSPTYTLTADTAPTALGKQYAVTALGGTQTGVLSHSVSSPFTINTVRPAAYKVTPLPNPTTGVLRNNPKNSFSTLTRKGVLPLAGQASELMTIKTIIEIPAGADTADPLSVKAAISAHFGAVWASANNIADLVITGVL